MCSKFNMALSTLALTSSLIRFNNSNSLTVSPPPTDNLLIYLKFLASDFNFTYKTLTNYGSLAGSINVYAPAGSSFIFQSGIKSVNNLNDVSYAVFPGNTNSYISLPFFVAALGSYTFMMWMKIKRTTSNFTNLLLYTYSGSYGGAIIMEISNANVFDLSGPASKQITDSTYLYNTADIWIHVCGIYTFNPTTTFCSFYLNGSFKSSTTVYAGTDNTSTRTGYLGKASWDSNQFIQGSIRGFRMYGRALTANEVMSCYQND